MLIYLFDVYQQLQEFFHKEQLFQVINRHLINVFLKQYHVFEVIFDDVLEFYLVLLYVMEYPNIFLKAEVHHIKILM